MKAQKIILLLIALIIFPGLSIAQENNEGRDFSTKSGRTNLENTLQTDGYGLNGSNKYLSGLGTSSDYVSIAHHSEFNQGIDGSIEAWVYITNASQINYVIAKGSTSGTTSFSLFISTGREMRMRFGGVQAFSTGGQIPLNKWTHIAVTWLDVGTDIDVNFYIDGDKIGNTVTVTGEIPDNTDEIRIGGAEYASGSFQGYIDEVRFWGSVITQEQIRANRFIGLGETPASNFDETNFEGSTSYADLISSWTFNVGLSTWTWEYIGGHYGVRHGGAVTSSANYGYPMPYNNALYFPQTGSDNNFIELRDSTGFTNELDDQGTIELWAKLDDGIPGQKVSLISKGATELTNSFYLGLTANGFLAFRIGQNTVTSQKGSVPVYRWFHTAATWQKSGSIYIVKLYVNGELDDSLIVNMTSMPVNTDPVRIGKSEGFFDVHSPENAFVDELKIWKTAQTQDDIRKLMFASESAIGQLYSNDILASWSFDGDLIPSGRFLRMRGTFDVGTTNNCRFSSYYADYLYHGNILNTSITPNITVMKSEDPVAHAFPMGFYLDTPFDTIPYGNPNGINSIINVGPSFPDNNVSTVELFLSAQAFDLEDFEITLTAPNGQTRTVMSHIGGSTDNILTIFSDAASMNVNDPEYIAPWTTSAKPMQSFGSFNNSPARGNWILNIKQLGTMSSMGNGPSIINGWGIRLNGQTVTGIQSVTTELPKNYELSQNYPNPFNPSTSIKFSIPQSELVSLKVYDILGKEVATLVNSKLNAGVFEYNFDASKLSSGVYFYRLQAGSFVEIKKMMLLK